MRKGPNEYPYRDGAEIACVGPRPRHRTVRPSRTTVQPREGSQIALDGNGTNLTRHLGDPAHHGVMVHLAACSDLLRPALRAKH